MTKLNLKFIQILHEQILNITLLFVVWIRNYYMIIMSFFDGWVLKIHIPSVSTMEVCHFYADSSLYGALKGKKDWNDSRLSFMTSIIVFQNVWEWLYLYLHLFSIYDFCVCQLHFEMNYVKPCIIIDDWSASFFVESDSLVQMKLTFIVDTSLLLPWQLQSQHG